ncbi:tfiih basal transcription factor complex helicase subunit, putative [Ichthyophthirius multifiliis]|uniref:DNA 5'-3' helicase n=1 Tax=Ichthyophthirius multifiliis TaxID=5932 RepID=G0QQJ1_ICHMU|nr:tfiih basal transcription factor complex helicase subunit, putative [Ichthyophthirius multifiliis]EGR32513.1 tfiih basal transcription factor complex helicase subunit, putative [Ichthyophthirius multifiliis]|eukprot:XP_004036499.1 tfiih basal transcription factor complex helicase subunit, putative [Ichthyophthirius multifiliis]
MKFYINDLPVYFPYQSLYKEQLEYMKDLKLILDNQGHGIIEMPTGTGKTVCLLSLISSYLLQNQGKFKKLLYCTRTVVEMEKTIEELKFVLENTKKYILEEKREFKFLCTALSARSNLCINPLVQNQQKKEKIDDECLKLTAKWVRFRGEKGEQKLCTFFENFEEKKEEIEFKEGIYNIDDLKEIGKQKNICPYFLARKLVNDSNIVVYNYMYLLSPQMKDIINKSLQKDCIVVFDEAHNIDNICLDVFTVNINKRLLDSAYKNVEQLELKIDNMKNQSQQSLENEYKQLLNGLKKKILLQKNNFYLLIKGVFEELAKQSIPLQIRLAKPFVLFLKKILMFLKNKLKEKNCINQDPPQFLSDMQIQNHIDQTSLKFAEERLSQLFMSLEITDNDEYVAITTIAQFSTLLAMNQRGFKIIFQPSPLDGSLSDPLLTFTCLDSSLAIQNVFKEYASVILTSGTMSPLDIYPKILNFNPFMLKSIDIELSRNSINPIIVTKGLDFTALSSEFEARQNMTVTRSFGALLIDISKICPDGIVAFFPSYRYMEQIIFEWDQDGILDELRKYKLVYFESKDVAQTSQSLFHFRRACDYGRGAIFFSIARGKVAEGIDFNEQYGRCVIMLGFPVQNSNDPILLERVKYLTENFKVTKNEYIEFDAMRQCAQCLGRVMRGKNDYGLMIMAEKRFARSLVKKKLPEWIKKQIKDYNVDISSEVVSAIAVNFFKEMGQEFIMNDKSFFNQQQLLEMQDILQIKQSSIDENLQLQIQYNQQLNIDEKNQVFQEKIIVDSNNQNEEQIYKNISKKFAKKRKK